MEGFPSNLIDTFTSTRECAEPMLPMCHVKVKVTVKGQIFNKQYYTLCRVCSILHRYQWKDFLKTWMTYSPQLGDVQSPCCPCVSSRSRSQLKVKYLTNKYYTLCRVRSITPLLMKRFPLNLNDTFTSTRGYAEPMLPMCQLKVKVTVKGQILNKQIIDIMACPLYKPYTNGRISLDVHCPCCPCVSSRSSSQLNVK